MNRIADLRPNIETIDHAKSLMSDLARVTCIIEIAKARLELLLQKAKAAHVEKVAEPVGELEALEAQLRTFILTHKSLFQKPRKVATEFGHFGLQEVSEVVVADEEALFQHCLEKGFSDCFKVVRSPLKMAIKARLEAGENLPGCSLKTGDTAVYKITRSLIDREVESAIPDRALSARAATEASEAPPRRKSA